MRSCWWCWVESENGSFCQASGTRLLLHPTNCSREVRDSTRTLIDSNFLGRRVSCVLYYFSPSALACIGASGTDRDRSRDQRSALRPRPRCSRDNPRPASAPRRRRRALRDEHWGPDSSPPRTTRTGGKCANSHLGTQVWWKWRRLESGAERLRSEERGNRSTSEVFFFYDSSSPLLPWAPPPSFLSSPT